MTRQPALPFHTDTRSHVAPEFLSSGESLARYVAESPLSWIRDRHCRLLSCRESSPVYTGVQTCIPPAFPLLLPRPCSPGGLPRGVMGKGSFLGCHPSPTPGFTSNCAVNSKVTVCHSESTEFPPGLLPGAKVGMHSLFFLFRLWGGSLFFYS